MSSDEHLAGFETQILNSQQIIVRLNGELDSALLRINALENILAENQTDLHEKRQRIQQLNDEITERESNSERLVDEMRSQIVFDEKLRQLISENLHEEFSSPEELVDRFRSNQRVEFHDLLLRTLQSDDISQWLDSDDVLFETLTHLNSLSRLKQTLSHDSQQLQRIRSFLHLTDEMNLEEFLRDLINKRECLDYLRLKIQPKDETTDFDLIKSLLGDYFNYQHEQFQCREFLQIESDENLSYSRLFIERQTQLTKDLEEFDQLKEEHKILIQKDDVYHKSMGQLMDKFYGNAEPTVRIRLDKICDIFDQFFLQYSQLTSSNVETVNLMKIVEEIPLILDEFNQLKNFIAQLDSQEISNPMEKLKTFVNEKNEALANLNEKLVEHEDSLDQLRTQRERMLNKMKEIKTNNEHLTSQVIEMKVQIEQIEQKLCSAISEKQMASDECRTHEEFHNTMKLENQSLQNEIENQRKLYESRCRQIINEKNQLEKQKKDLIEEKQLVEEEIKRLKNLLQSIRDSLDEVEDDRSIVDAIRKIQNESKSSIAQLRQRYEQLEKENRDLRLTIEQKENLCQQRVQIENKLEQRLLHDEQQIKDLKQKIEAKDNQYERLQEELQISRETALSNAAVIHVEPTVAPVLSKTQWTTIDVQDEEIPLESTIDKTTVFLNLLGELKSKLGITLTHRPRSSSVFFLYLCVVHLFTFYSLFIGHC